MRMRGYMLDTHILIWFLINSNQLNRRLYDAICYFEENYYISIEVLHEIVTLQELNKVDTGMTIRQIAEILNKYDIKILPISIDHLEKLERLSVPVINGKEHLDPMDRIMIAQSICEKMILISSDEKFVFYKDRGFQLMEN